MRVGGNIKVPTKIQHVSPVYPQEAQDARVSGMVIIEATINAEGSVESAKVLRSIPMLDQAALDAVKQWRFTPTDSQWRAGARDHDRHGELHAAVAGQIFRRRTHELSI